MHLDINKCLNNKMYGKKVCTKINSHQPNYNFIPKIKPMKMDPIDRNNDVNKRNEGKQT